MHSLCPLKLHDCASIYDNSTWYTFIILIPSASQVGKGTNFEIVRTTFALGWPFVIEVEYYLLAGIYLWRISLTVAVHWSLIFACTYAVAADHNVAFHPVERDERHVDNLLQHHWQWKKKRLEKRVQAGFELVRTFDNAWNSQSLLTRPSGR